MYRLVGYEIPPADIESLLFTHHNFDHDAAFFHFVLVSWSLGREQLALYGPPGAGDLFDSLYDLYESDIAYREQFDYPREGIEDLQWTSTSEGTVVEADGLTASTMPVDQSIGTYAYRFDDAASGKSIVISGDTRTYDSITEFASGADVLVQDCCVGPVDDSPPDSARGLILEDRIRELPRGDPCETPRDPL